MSSLFGDLDLAKADQSVVSLFASSKPIGPPEPRKTKQKTKNDDDIALLEQELGRTLSDEELEDDDDEDGKSQAKNKTEVAVDKQGKKRKRQAKELEDESSALEAKYIQKLLDDDTVTETPKKLKKSKHDKSQDQAQKLENAQNESKVEDESIENDDDDDDDDDDDENQSNDEGSNGLENANKSTPVHESLLKENEELEKAKRTIFVGNVPSAAIESKNSYATLKKHFAEYGDIQSVRFRSIAFSEMLPRKVAFIKQKLHDKRSTVNAYIVYDSEASARKALQSNGAVLLDHHVRVDSVAHPAKQDIKRSIFIGNLDFEAEEETLWQYFSKIGELEYVRIIRDSKTNVGKGFAYAQFKDAMYVSKALLLNEKKMGEKGRKLRISRAKPIRKFPTTNGDHNKSNRVVPGIPGIKLNASDKEKFGRAKKILGKADRSQIAVVEGERSVPGRMKGSVALGLGKKKTKPRIRARSTAFRKARKENNKK
ncbi:hypothetical protein V1514DRAFT_288808 [Lipomyces japonicus]|uniref:uncharacterized protein n=1 Tax=Lipomyces japonicus TaxID=56871 RepID=UPI0034CDBAB2